MEDEKTLEKIINKKDLFLTKEEFFKIKNEGIWRNDPHFPLIETITRLARINSKSLSFPNTISYTNFFRKNRKDIFVKGNLEETVRKFKEKIFEDEDAKELFTREMKDYYYIIKLYIDAAKSGKSQFKLPTTKGKWKYTDLPDKEKLKDGWRNLDLKTRKAIKDYIFTKNFSNSSLRETDKKLFRNIKSLENITIEKICKWVEYMGLWSTAVGTPAEFYIMDELRKNVPEIKWRWPTDEEDVNNYDIVGSIGKIIIPIQVKLVQSARVGEPGINVSEVFLLYCKETNEFGTYQICPVKFGISAWIALFKQIAKENKV
jgi:hypothetical protein